MTGTSANAAVRVGENVLRRVRSTVDPLTTQSQGRSRPDDGWLAVTVLCEPADLDVDHLPAPLAELGDQIDVRVDAAPADQGTELRVRLREASSSSVVGRLAGSDGRAELRSALREAKQLIEVGEVLRVDPAPHGERPSTPGGLLLEAWTRVAPKGGVL